MSAPRSDAAGSDDDADADGGLLDDQPVTSVPYRVGDVFNVYDGTTSVKYKVTRIVERGDRRLTYGEPETSAD